MKGSRCGGDVAPGAAGEFVQVLLRHPAVADRF